MAKMPKIGDIVLLHKDTCRVIGKQGNDYIAVSLEDNRRIGFDKRTPFKIVDTGDVEEGAATEVAKGREPSPGETGSSSGDAGLTVTGSEVEVATIKETTVVEPETTPDDSVEEPKLDPIAANLERLKNGNK